MAKVPLKPATTVAQQIEKLRGRGMRVDEAFASQWLANVSYYRLSAYWFPARIVDDNGIRSDRFAPGTSFQDAAALYEADRKLRTLVHDGTERIEIALRTRIGDAISVDDPLAYEDSSNFRGGFDHAKWLTTAHSRVTRAGRRNEAIKHYASKYEGCYPFWVLAEVLDFSDVSRLYEGIPPQVQQEVAENLRIDIDYSVMDSRKRRAVLANPPLARWLEQLTIVRNACAHHARLWNKSFVPAPTNALRTIPALRGLPLGQSERMYGVLVVMSYLLRVVSPGTTWPDKVTELVNAAFLTNPIVQASSLGIPEDWGGAF